MDPAWHDVPPVPGDYQVQFEKGIRGTRTVLANENYSAQCGWKWYGPLPDPPPIPEPPKRPRLFRCRWREDKKVTRVGILFHNNRWYTFSENGVRGFDGQGSGDLEREYADIVFDDGAPA